MILAGTTSAAQRYGQLESERNTYLQRARRAAELTIPTLVPPEGNSSATQYLTPFQSVGARGVNNLASKLLLALLPPNSPFFRLSLDDADMAALGEDKRGAVEKKLSDIERRVMTKIETSAIRVPAYEALKQLIVAGNVLLYLPPKGGMRVFRLDRYVVKRDSMGNPLEIVIKEQISPLMLPPEAQALIGERIDHGSKDIDLYTHIVRREKRWYVHQELMGKQVPESEGEFPLEKFPYLPLRFTRIDGEDYGRSYVEEYLGDLASLEGLMQAIVEGSAAAAKLLFLVRPNGTTKAANLAKTPNGGFATGDVNDVGTLQINKAADFSVAQETAKTITDRLAYAFLMNTAVRRDAERVTAEEIRFMAQELESAIGGVYSILSQELQLPLIQLMLSAMQESGDLPKMPKDTLKPSITTGMEALGRGQDLNKLATFLKFLEPLGPEVIAQEMNLNDYIDRLAASLGIDTQGLIKTQDQKTAEQAAAAQAQQQAMVMQTLQGVAQKAGPDVVSRMMDQQQAAQ